MSMENPLKFAASVLGLAGSGMDPVELMTMMVEFIQYVLL